MQICWQEKAQDWCTPRKTKIHLAFISIFCLLFNIPTFFELTWGADGVKWTNFLLDRNYFIIYNLWLRLTIRCALPIICLVTLSSFVVIKVILNNVKEFSTIEFADQNWLELISRCRQLSMDFVITARNALGFWICGCRCILESSGSQNSGCT